MLGQPITDEEVVAGVRAVVVTARILLRTLSDPDVPPLDPGDAPVVVDIVDDEPPVPSPRAAARRGLARRGGELARRRVTSHLERWSAERPGGAGWSALDPERRSDWWLGTVGRLTAIVASLPGLAGPVGERVPVKDLISAAGQGLLLCAIAHEHGVEDTDDYVLLLAAVILDRDVTAAVVRAGGRPGGGATVHTVAGSGAGSAPSRFMAAGTVLVGMGRKLHALRSELENRPRGHVGQRVAGSLPVVGVVGQYRGERRGLRIVADRGRRWCAERAGTGPGRGITEPERMIDHGEQVQEMLQGTERVPGVQGTGKHRVVDL